MEKILNIYLKTEGSFTLEQFIYLYLIYNKDYELADKLLHYEGFYDEIWQLSDRSFIKITNLEHKFVSDQIILRSKGEELFKELNKSNIKTAEEIFNYFKQIFQTYTNKPSRMQFSTIKQYLVGRVNQGVTLDNAKLIIDFKFKKWWNTEFKAYLTLQTLLSPSKYPKYLTEIELSESFEGSTLNKMG